MMEKVVNPIIIQDWRRARRLSILHTWIKLYTGSLHPQKTEGCVLVRQTLLGPESPKMVQIHCLAQKPPTLSPGSAPQVERSGCGALVPVTGENKALFPRPRTVLQIAPTLLRCVPRSGALPWSPRQPPQVLPPRLPAQSQARLPDRLLRSSALMLPCCEGSACLPVCVCLFLFLLKLVPRARSGRTSSSTLRSFSLSPPRTPGVSLPAGGEREVNGGKSAGKGSRRASALGKGGRKREVNPPGPPSFPPAGAANPKPIPSPGSGHVTPR